MIDTIHIYHTNDIHSHFENWPRIRQYLLDQKKTQEDNVFLFDIGDFIDRFHPFTDGTRGKGNVELLNECRFDGVTIGNNEGITLSHEDLSSLYQKAEFDIILANLYFQNGERPEWAKPFQIYETPNHTKIGVIGVTVNYSNFYEPLKWSVTDPIEELKKWVPIVKKQADIIIVLSHLGLSDDERIAKEVPEVDIVLGGHTHHILPEGKFVNNSLLCCTGKHGQYIGKVEIEFERGKSAVINKKAEIIPAHGLNKVEGEELFDSILYDCGKKILLNPVAYLPKKLESNWFHETELSKLLCQSLTEWCDADCSFLNAGILIEGLEKGIVTEYDLQKICPHPINPCTIKLSGVQLKEVLIQTVDDQFTSLELKGFGFRGKVFGKIIYDRVEILGEGSSAKIFIRGKEINPDKIYTLATIDMFAFARFYPELTRNEKRFFLPEFVRDLLKWKLQRTFPLEEGMGESLFD